MKSDLILQNDDFKSCLSKIEKLEYNRIFCKHDVEHLGEVKRIMLLLNKRNCYNLDLDLIIAAAYLHDIGRIKEYTENKDHRTAGKDIIIKILSACDYDKNEIEIVLNAISNHNKPTVTKDLQNLLYKADKLSRECYKCDVISLCKWSDELKNKEKYE